MIVSVPFQILKPFFKENKGFYFVQKENDFDLTFRCRICQNMGFVDNVANNNSKNYNFHDEKNKENSENKICILI